MGPFREIRMKKTALDGLNWMIQPPCLLMRLRDYFKIKDKIRTKIRTKKTAPAGRTTRRMDFNPETLSIFYNFVIFLKGRGLEQKDLMKVIQVVSNGQ